jgi:hypothetical protein
MEGYIMEKINYYEVKKKYLAEALSFLGFHYYKDGFGKETIFKFEDTDKFKEAMLGLNKLKEKLGSFVE